MKIRGYTFTVHTCRILLCSCSDLNFTHEVSESHVVLDHEVCVQTFGGDAALLLQRGTVENPSTAGGLLHPRGGRGFGSPCRTDGRLRTTILFLSPRRRRGWTHPEHRRTAAGSF